MARHISLPEQEEYGAYYQGYINKVNGNPIDVLSRQIDQYTDLIHENSNRMDYRYAEGKWSIRESLIHLIDSEQIFAYRALRISRGDQTPLAGFNQDDYIAGNNFDHITPWEILEEFTHQRRATLSMIKKFTDQEIARIGVASDTNTSVRALIFIMAGHAQHHIELFNERYM
ncbi:MAG: DinB family protein [Saprospiraceae bacterium]|nr:DinB family protein [Saprospiraceae bacterium]